MFWNVENIIILQRLNAIVLAQQAQLTLLQQMYKQESKMAISLTAITAEVANDTSVTNSVLTLVSNLVAQIAAIPPSNDPVTQAALDALTATLAGNDTSIAAAVTANTPAAPVVPPVSNG